MPTVHLLRRYFPTHTTGALVGTDNARGNLLITGVTLELPWRDNAPRLSCIAEGTYRVVERQSPKHGRHYHILDVPAREWILFHPATYVFQLLGCIIPGARFSDLNADGVPDILDTRKTLDRMLATLGKEFTLHILSAPVPGGTLPAAEITAPAP